MNWTMPRPWHWNWLGYYHFVYMSTQFSYMLLYLTQLAGHLSKGEITPARLNEAEYYSGDIGTTVRADYLPVTVHPRPVSGPAPPCSTG